MQLGTETPFCEICRTLRYNFAISFRNANEFLPAQKHCQSLMIIPYLYQIRQGLD